MSLKSINNKQQGSQGSKWECDLGVDSDGTFKAVKSYCVCCIKDKWNNWQDDYRYYFKGGKCCFKNISNPNKELI